MSYSTFKPRNTGARALGIGLGAVGGFGIGMMNAWNQAKTPEQQANFPDWWKALFKKDAATSTVANTPAPVEDKSITAAVPDKQVDSAISAIKPLPVTDEQSNDALVKIKNAADANEVPPDQFKSDFDNFVKSDNSIPQSNDVETYPVHNDELLSTELPENKLVGD